MNTITRKYFLDRNLYQPRTNEINKRMTFTLQIEVSETTASRFSLFRYEVLIQSRYQDLQEYLISLGSRWARNIIECVNSQTGFVCKPSISDQ